MILDGELTWRGADTAGYHVFDIMRLDGRDLTSLPLDERRALLGQLPLEPPLQRVLSLDDPKPWERACREGWEGVIAKRRDSKYEHRRSPHWLKMKCEASQELVVGGFTDPQGARVGLGALLVGYFRRATISSSPARSAPGSTPGCCSSCAPGWIASRSRRRRSPGRTGLPRLRAHWVAPGDRRPGRLHRVDGARQAAPSAAARRPLDKAGARRRQGNAVITHPEKVLFPDDGITKGELAGYYESIAPVMLPHIRGRPLTMERYPAGIGKKGFWQKDVSKGFPEWLERVEVPKKDGTVHHPLITDTRSLLWVANQNTITPHVWVSRVPELYYPDVCVFDLDPPDDRRAGRAARGGARAPRPAGRARSSELGEDIGLEGLPHRRLARREVEDRPRSRDSPTRSARGWSSATPQHLTQEFSKADRGGRILVDTGRNGYSATFAAAYAVRAKARRAGVRAVHVAGGRGRHRRPADVHAADDGRARRGGRRSVVGPPQAPAGTEGAGREAAAAVAIPRRQPAF